MPLSVPNSNGGAGLSGLLRQTRPAKGEGGNPTGAAEPPAATSVRPVGRSGIDSTQRGTAQIAAALTVYMSKLDGDEPAVAPATKASAAGAGPSAASRSSAADLLRTLDSYGAANRLRLTG